MLRDDDPRSIVIRAAAIVRLRLDARLPAATDDRREILHLTLLEVLKGSLDEQPGDAVLATLATTGGPADPAFGGGPDFDDLRPGQELLAFCGPARPGEGLGQRLGRDAHLLALDDPDQPFALSDVRAVLALDTTALPAPDDLVPRLAPFGPLLAGYLYDRAGAALPFLDVVETEGAPTATRIELLSRLVADATAPDADVSPVAAADLLLAMLRLLLRPDLPAGLQRRIRTAYLRLLLMAPDGAPRMPPQTLLPDDATRAEWGTRLGNADDPVDRFVGAWLRREPWKDDLPPPLAVTPIRRFEPEPKYTPEPKQAPPPTRKPPPRRPPRDCRIDEIQVEIPRTLPLTPRLGNDVDNDTFTSRETNERFEGRPFLVVMFQPNTVAFLTAISPDDAPIVWDIKRAPDDVPAVGAPNLVPTLTPDPEDRRRAILSFDQRGSFIITARCLAGGDDDAAEEIPRGSRRILKVVMVEAALVADMTVTNPGAVRVTNRGGVFAVRYGRGGRRAGIDFEATVLLIGGRDGSRGVDRARAGWVNSLNDSTIEGSYDGGRTIRGIFVSNPSQGGGPANRYFLPGRRPPQPIDPPLLDTARDGAGRGGITATFGDSTDARRRRAGIGTLVTVRADDTPRVPIVVRHPAARRSRLTTFQAQIAFHANLALWTRQNPQTYVVVRDFDWVCDGSFSVNPLAAIGGNPTIAISNARTPANPLRARDEAGAEVRAPTALDTFKFDAR